MKSNNKNTVDKRAFSIKEAAEYACVSRGTIENWLLSGLLPFEQLPGRGKGSYYFRRIRKTDLDMFLNKFYKAVPKANADVRKSYTDLILLPRDA